jgi:NAD(P)-dependent dehydrogenase (short-subunit alcohol dehydrogenase family)
MRSIVITGTSTGIGHASVKMLLAAGFRIFGSVRKQSDADRLRAEFGANFVPLLFDVTDETAVLAAACEVRETLNGETLAGLVNNAGIVVSGPFLELSLEDFRRQIEINLMGPVIATRAFMPLLGADASLKGARGRIVMVSSTSGRDGSPLISPYCTSKHAIEGLAESLRREFMLFGIDVVLIAPGAVKTPLLDTVAIDNPSLNHSPFRPALNRIRDHMSKLAGDGIEAETIGAAIRDAFTLQHPRVRYEITNEPMQMLVMRALPKRLIDWIIAKQLGLLPPRRTDDADVGKVGGA